MGIELLGIGVQMRKVLFFSMKECSRIILKHPFLASMLCFIAFLYRSFPFMFSILVAASPVLVCTAVLLGTLLSFGQPNIPEIEREEKTSHDIVSLKAGLLCDTTTCIESEDSYFVERYTDNDLSPLLEERSREIQFASGVFEANDEENVEKHDDEELPVSQYSSIPGVDTEFNYEKPEPLLGDEFYDQNDEKNVEEHGDGELMESRDSPIPRVDSGKSIEFGYERSDSLDSKRVNLDSLPGSPWKKESYEQNDEKNEEKHGDKELMESQYSPIPRVDSGRSIEFGYEKSDSFDSKRANLDSLSGSPWKKEESEKEEYEDEDEDDLDSGSDRAESSSPDASMADIIPMLDELHPLLEEEEAPRPATLSSHDGSDASSESSGKSSESDDESDDGHETHEDLEAADDENEEEEEETQDKEGKSKSAITWTEEDQKNLIDLGSSELERNQRLESLITRRRALKKMRMMMTEKNLIDLESADLPFNLSPISTTRNNPFDVSSNVDYDLGLPPIPGSAPSVLVPRRNPFDLPYDSSEEKPDLMEDGFGQEFMTCHSKDNPLFRRYETFIVRPSSLRPYFVPERMASEGTSYSTFQRQSSELSDFSKVSSVPETESLGSVEDLGDVRDKNVDEGEVTECKDFVDEQFSEEPGLISKLEHISEHGSESSEEVESLEQLRIVETHHEVEEFLVKAEVPSKPETSDQRYSSQSSSSSLSVSERIFTDKEEEMRSSLEETMGHIEQNVISRETSFDRSDFQVTSTSEDHTLHVEPIYDSSPSAIMENIFSSSFASDHHVESETVSFVRREFSETSQDIEQVVPINEEILAPLDELELISQEDEVVGSASASPAPEFDVDDASINSELSANEGTVEHAQKQHSSSIFDADTHIIASQGAVVQAVESLSISSELQSIHAHREADEEETEDREVTERAVKVIESIDEASTVDNLNVSEENEVPPIINSPHSPDSMSNVQEVDETALLGLKNNFLDEAENDNRVRVLENYVLPPEETDFHHNEQYIVEETDGIEDIDELLLSELDTVGDFSINKFASKHDDFERKFPLHPEASHGDFADEDVKFNLDAQETVSEISSVLEGAKLESTQSSRTEVPPKEVMAEKETESGMAELEAKTIQDIESAFWKVFEKEFTKSDVLEQSDDDQVSTSVMEDFGMSVLEAQRIEDIELAFGLTCEKEMENSNVLELPNEEQVTEGSRSSDHEAAVGLSPSVPEDSRMSVLEAQTVEDIELAYGQTCEEEMEHSDVLELPNAELVTEENWSSDNAAAFEVSSSVQEDFGMPVLKAQKVEDIELAFNQVSVKGMENSNMTEVPEASKGSNNAAAFEVPSPVLEDSRMLVLEAQKVEDIALAFTEASEKEIENSNVIETPQGLGSSDNAAPFEVSSSIQEDSGMPVLEAQKLEDIVLAFSQVSEKETENTNVIEVPEGSGGSDNATVFEVSSSVQEDSRMPVLEAQKVEDIELAFNQVSEKEMESSNVTEVPEGSGDSDNAAAFEVPNPVVEDSRMQVLDAQKVEDIALAFAEVSEKEIENSNVIETPQGSGSSDNAAAFEVSSSIQEDSGMPLLEAQKIEDIELAFNQITEKEIENLNVLGLVTEESENGPAPVEVSGLEDSEMPVLEAKTVEDIELAFNQTCEKEMENTNAAELLNTELVTEESGKDPERSGMKVLEAQMIEDIETVFTQVCEREAENTNAAELPNTELVTEESGKDPELYGMEVLEAQMIEDIETVFTQVREREAEKPMLQINAELETEGLGSSDNAAAALELPSHVTNLERTSTVYFDMDHEDELMAESKDTEAASLESREVDADSPLKPVSGGNLEKPVSSTFEGESAEAMNSSAREFNVSESGEDVARERDNEAAVEEAMPSSVEGKKDKTEKSGSSSSSSSSSDSSSSDSDKE